MEQGRSTFSLFIIIMIVGFVVAFLVYSRMFVISELHNVQDMHIYSNIISLINYIINPISVLIGFYYLGKNLDLKSNLKSVIARLVLGAYLGQFFGITILQVVGIIFIRGFDFYWLSYLSNIFSVLFLGIFFPAFTALAIAYIKQTD